MSPPAPLDTLLEELVAAVLEELAAELEADDALLPPPLPDDALVVVPGWAATPGAGSQPSCAKASMAAAKLAAPAPRRARFTLVSLPRARTIFLTVSALGVVAFLALGHAILLPFLLAAVLSYVLFPLVKRVERARVPRWAAILLVYLVTVGGAVGFASVVVPRLIGEMKSLATDLPDITKRIRNDWLPQIDARLQKWSAGSAPEPAASAPSAAPAEPAAAPPAPIVITPKTDGSYEIRFHDDLQLRQAHDGTWLLRQRREERRAFSSERALRDAFDKSIAHMQANSAELVQVGRQIVASISQFIFLFFMTLMLAGYMMFTYERIHGFVREMWSEERRGSFDRFVMRLDRGLAGVVRGQLLICLVNGALTAVGLWIFDVKYWPVLAIIAAGMSIIPIFGSILSSIPAVALALTQSFGTALGVLLWIVGIHQLEANFLNPKIIGDQAHIHPVLVVFSLLLGESLFGITGALLAVPALAVVQAVFMHFRESALGLREERASLRPPSGVTAASALAAITPDPPESRKKDLEESLESAEE
jgi:predicted PurR-regulated permease PerM